MSYTETGVTIIQTLRRGAGAILRVANAHADKILQCYVNGRLVARQSVPAATWTCEVSSLGVADVVGVLAVDPADAGRNVWAEAFADLGASNRLRVELPQTVAPWGPTDRWRIVRGAAGAATATIEVFAGRIYPGGRHACGYGGDFGGGFGYDAAEAVGFGHGFGRGEFAFDCQVLQWISEPLGPGAYPLAVTAVDAAGNESEPAECTVTLNAFPRPAADAAVVDYTRTTDTLVLSFTESEDIANG